MALQLLNLSEEPIFGMFDVKNIKGSYQVRKNTVNFELRKTDCSQRI